MKINTANQSKEMRFVMGYRIEVKCKKCKFKQMYHLGVGMMFPRVYQRIVDAVRNGEYGEEWKKFFEENTGAAIMAEQRLYQCFACKHLEKDYDLLKLPCPKCGSDLKIDDGICWD